MDRRTRDHALQSVPYGLFVVGSNEDGMAVTIVANWGMQVSFKPSLVAVSIENDSRMRAAIEKCRAFSVNLLPAKGLRVAKKFLKPREIPVGEYGGRLVTGSRSGMPFLNEAMACMECSVVASHAAGDHVLFIGEVTDATFRGGSDALTLRETGLRYRR